MMPVRGRWSELLNTQGWSQGTPLQCVHRMAIALQELVRDSYIKSSRKHIAIQLYIYIAIQLYSYIAIQPYSHIAIYLYIYISIQLYSYIAIQPYSHIAIQLCIYMAIQLCSYIAIQLWSWDPKVLGMQKNTLRDLGSPGL